MSNLTIIQNRVYSSSPGKNQKDSRVRTQDEKDSRVRTKEEAVKLILDIFCQNLGLDKPNEDSTSISRYQDLVLEKLKSNPEKEDPVLLKKLQMDIESQSINFDVEKNIHQMSGDLIKLFIDKEKVSAKEYIKSFINARSNSSNYTEVSHKLSYFEQYTLEVIMLHTLSIVFNNTDESPAVRLSTLVEQMNIYANVHIQRVLSMKDNKKDQNTNISQKKKKKVIPPTDAEYSLGNIMVTFLNERNLISISDKYDFSHETIKKKGKTFKKPPTKYVLCNFNISLLPVKFNLPMICEPIPWAPIEAGIRPTSLSDLRGGYLSQPLGDFYQRHKLLTSHDVEHFNIELGDKYNILLEVMNKLQGQPFEINKDVLNYINENYSFLVKHGLLMPRGLASLNSSKVISGELRDTFMDYYKVVEGKCSCSYKDIMIEFLVWHQRARYEERILKLAESLVGYRFYLPTFLDFRGRIYRSGILHFHERDLARSLLVFSIPDTVTDNESYIKTLVYTAAKFHYKKIYSYREADKVDIFNDDIFNDDLQELIRTAREPFQFISKVLALENPYYLYKVPITQDASASAFQIMAYLLLDTHIAESTNLFEKRSTNLFEKRQIDPFSNMKPPYDFAPEQIKDIYTSILEEIKMRLLNKNDKVFSYLNGSLRHILFFNILDLTLSDEDVRRYGNRKLIKQIYMPMIYGKKSYSISKDIAFYDKNSILTPKECMSIATILTEFFNDRFPGITNLMELFQNVGLILSLSNKPVYCSLQPLYNTIQDYMSSKDINIWVYFNKKHDPMNMVNRNRSKVTLRIPTEKRDPRKSKVSTFVNFIHQKDAGIAMSMVKRVIDELKAPIYTVHDNFITTAPYALSLSKLYLDVFIQGNYYERDPLSMVNTYLIDNLYSESDQKPDVRHPIPLKELKRVLNRLKPKPKYKKKNTQEGTDADSGAKTQEGTDADSGAKKKTKVEEKWDKIIDKILHNYQYYCNNACDIHHLGDESKYKAKLNKFIKNMYIYKTYYKTNYSLHL